MLNFDPVKMKEKKKKEEKTETAIERYLYKEEKGKPCFSPIKEFEKFELNSVCDFVNIINEFNTNIIKQIYNIESPLRKILKKLPIWEVDITFWYRGERIITEENSKTRHYPLVPSNFRDNPENILRNVSIEKDMYRYTWLHNHSDLDHSQLYSLDNLAMMRHYGLRARLLDFSTDPLTALFFALDGYRENEESYIYIIIPNLINFQLSFLNYSFLLSTPEDYNVYVRLRTYLYSKHLRNMDKDKNDAIRRIHKELKFNTNIFREEFELFEKLVKNFIRNDKEKNFTEIIESLKKEKYIPIEIYLTPIAVLFQHKIRYMERQKACGILYGDIYGKEIKEYSLLEQLKNKYFLIHYLDLSNFDISLLYRLRIPKSARSKLENELKEKLQISKYEIFGKDIRFLEDKIINRHRIHEGELPQEPSR